MFAAQLSQDSQLIKFSLKFIILTYVRMLRLQMQQTTTYPTMSSATFLRYKMTAATTIGRISLIATSTSNISKFYLEENASDTDCLYQLFTHLLYSTMSGSQSLLAGMRRTSRLLKSEGSHVILMSSHSYKLQHYIKTCNGVAKN